jgi:hypothetical protein
LIVLNLGLITVKGLGWRARNHQTYFIKGCVVARAEILSLIGDPTHAAAKMGADI